MTRSLSLLLDEDTERALATELRNAGHDVARVVELAELGPGSSDDEVRAAALREGRFLLTHDDDHVAAARSDAPAPRVFYVPNQRLGAHEIAHILDTILDAAADVDDLGDVVVLSEAWL